MCVCVCVCVCVGMRELWATGWMQQTLRMVCAAFLTEQLQVHWVEGAKWYHDTLVDADLAINRYVCVPVCVCVRMCVTAPGRLFAHLCALSCLRACVSGRAAEKALAHVCVCVCVRVQYDVAERSQVWFRPVGLSAGPYWQVTGVHATHAHTSVQVWTNSSPSSFNNTLHSCPHVSG